MMVPGDEPGTLSLFFVILTNYTPFDASFERQGTIPLSCQHR